MNNTVGGALERAQNPNPNPQPATPAVDTPKVSNKALRRSMSPEEWKARKAAAKSQRQAARPTKDTKPDIRGWADAAQRVEAVSSIPPMTPGRVVWLASAAGTAFRPTGLLPEHVFRHSNGMLHKLVTAAPVTYGARDGAGQEVAQTTPQAWFGWTILARRMRVPMPSARWVTNFQLWLHSWKLLSAYLPDVPKATIPKVVLGTLPEGWDSPYPLNDDGTVTVNGSRVNVMASTGKSGPALLSYLRDQEAEMRKALQAEAATALVSTEAFQIVGWSRPDGRTERPVGRAARSASEADRVASQAWIYHANAWQLEAASELATDDLRVYRFAWRTDGGVVWDSIVPAIYQDGRRLNNPRTVSSGVMTSEGGWPHDLVGLKADDHAWWGRIKAGREFFALHGDPRFGQSDEPDTLRDGDELELVRKAAYYYLSTAAAAAGSTAAEAAASEEEEPLLDWGGEQVEAEAEQVEVEAEAEQVEAEVEQVEAEVEAEAEQVEAEAEQVEVEAEVEQVEAEVEQVEAEVEQVEAEVEQVEVEPEVEAEAARAVLEPVTEVVDPLMREVQQVLSTAGAPRLEVEDLSADGLLALATAVETAGRPDLADQLVARMPDEPAADAAGLVTTYEEPVQEPAPVAEVTVPSQEEPSGPPPPRLSPKVWVAADTAPEPWEVREDRLQAELETHPDLMVYRDGNYHPVLEVYPSLAAPVTTV